MLADCARAFGAGLRNEAGDFAGAGRGRFERLVEQAGETGQALLEVFGADIQGSDQRIELNAAFVDAVFSALVAVVDNFYCLDKVAAMNVELTRQLPQVGDDLGRDVTEGRNIRLDAPCRISCRRGNLVHCGDELGYAHHERVFECAHVLMSSTEHFLQHDVCLAQPLEKCGCVGS